MKVLIVRAALLSTFAFGALLGGGSTLIGPDAAEARMDHSPPCFEDVSDGTGWWECLDIDE